MLHKRVQEVMLKLLGRSMFDGELSPHRAVIVFDDGLSVVSQSVTPTLKDELVYSVVVPKMPRKLGTSPLSMKIDHIIFHDKYGNKTFTYKDDGTLPRVLPNDIVNVVINIYYDTED